MGNVTTFDDEAVQGTTEMKDKISHYIKFQEQDINSHFDDKGLRVLSLSSTRGMQDLDGHFFLIPEPVTEIFGILEIDKFPENVRVSRKC